MIYVKYVCIRLYFVFQKKKKITKKNKSNVYDYYKKIVTISMWLFFALSFFMYYVHKFIDYFLH